MPAVQNLSGYQGDTFRQPLRLRSISGGVLGDPINLTGWSFTSQIRADVGGVVLATITVTVRDQSVLDNVGWVDMYMAPATTAAIAPGVYFYDLQGTEPNGDVFTRLKGEFTIEGDITRG